VGLVSDGGSDDRFGCGGDRGGTCGPHDANATDAFGEVEREGEGGRLGRRNVADPERKEGNDTCDTSSAS
jgi:hypothetical protein